MLQKGKIPALKAGKMWGFRKEDIDEWLLRKSFNHNNRREI
jgi:excisionase family DNA binding protein